MADYGLAAHLLSVEATSPIRSSKSIMSVPKSDREKALAWTASCTGRSYEGEGWRELHEPLNHATRETRSRFTVRTRAFASFG